MIDKTLMKNEKLTHILHLLHKAHPNGGQGVDSLRTYCSTPQDKHLTTFKQIYHNSN